MKRKISLLMLLLFWMMTSFAKPLSEADANQIAQDVYIYAYPLMMMDMTKRVMTNVQTPGNMRAPLNQFVHTREFASSDAHDMTTPNMDTLSSVAWVDLAKEPYILHVPNEKGRYYSMTMLDGWTEVLASPGTRTTGTGAHDFALVGPHFKGKLPRGVKPLKSETDIVWIVGKTFCDGSPQDLEIVHSIQDQYTLTPLSAYGKSYTPPSGTVDPSIDMQTIARDQVDNMNSIVYFTRFAEILKSNTPDQMDQPMIAKLAAIGITPGQSLDVTKLDPMISKALDNAVKISQEKIKAYESTGISNKNGWLFSMKTGSYGTDYLQRALVAAVGLGANPPEDAIYPVKFHDTTNQTLNGLNRYVLHFEKNQIPPVRGLWSVTMYNDQYFFVPNPLNRYALSKRDKLKFNPDGSLDLYVQSEAPPAALASNWLPAPLGDFVLMLRLYWPKESVLSGRWNPPVITKV